MYAFLLILLLGIALILILAGLSKQNWTVTISGFFLGVLTGVFFWFLDFWGEALWFEAVGYSGRFWKVIITKIGISIIGALLGLLIISILTWPISKQKWIIKSISKVIAAYIGIQWFAANWDKTLLFLNRVSTDIKDPILGRETSFYLFTLPFYESLYGLLLLLTGLGLITSLLSLFIEFQGKEIQLRDPQQLFTSHQELYAPVYLSLGGLLFVLAWGKYLDRFALMYSSMGAVTGPGWTDVNIRMPLYMVIVFVTILAGLILVVPRFKNLIIQFIPISNQQTGYTAVLPLVIVVVMTAGIWFVLLGIIPGIFQWLKVQPNEITVEKPYIKHNIEFTRQGFGLNRIEEKRFPVSGTFTQQMINQNRNILENIRLWDWRALDSVYKQFQEIRLYYEFSDVDIDRYTIQNKYRQVMVSAREIQLSNLPAQSQTFVNKRFKYTHGNGMTLTKVSEFTPEGLPNLLIKDIPPQSTYPELKVDQPRIYYGELTKSHVIVNTREKELDYPRGEKNVYIHYSGNGGVQISNLFRKFLFGWKFDGTRLFFSTYPTSDSRIMFRREITERVNSIAPFLKFDDDPYLVLANGKMYWFIDAYTVSADYPYSEPTMSGPRTELLRRRLLPKTIRDRMSLTGINYIRNSVKAVIDAFEGTVTFYIFDEEDPLIQTWAKIFPDMFKNRDEMPRELLSHIRYPSDMLLTQGLMYAKYHMTDPVVFYNQEDLWVRATEKYYDQTQPVEPYYIMWEMPDSDDPQFVLMLPFTPKNKQVLIAWIAGMCDPENYGRLLAYKFPKEKRVLGTQQVETKIDQDRVLSGQLSLWDQRGSRVIRGNVLVIPIEDTLIYVEPRLVAIMHNDKLSYAQTFDKALEGLYKKGKPVTKIEAVPTEASVNQLIQEANTAFENYLNLLGQKQFNEASKELENLQQSLNELIKTTKQNEMEEKQ